MSHPNAALKKADHMRDRSAMGSNSYMVELRNVTLRFERKRFWTPFLSLSIHRNDSSSSGKSGAGKTTILRLVLGILEPTAWSVFSSGSRSRDLRRAISNVPVCASAWFTRTL